MIEYHGTVNDGRIFITKTISQLKRLASREANNTFKTMDVLQVTTHDVNKGINTDIVRFQRINKVMPNNTIQRGIWKKMLF